MAKKWTIGETAVAQLNKYAARRDAGPQPSKVPHFPKTTPKQGAFAYDVNVAQGTINNLIEGDPLSVAFFDARIEVTDSHFGEGTQQTLDEIIGHYWPQSVNDSVADFVISILKDD